MDKNLLIEIFVPTTDRDGSGRIGTGYPVGANRILTARHVLFPPTRAPDKPIEVRWHHQTGELRKWQLAEIVWDGGETFDVAVIACDFPDELPDSGFLSFDDPTTNDCWESQGFAAAGVKEDGERSAVSMKGTVYSAADSATTFELGVDHQTTLPNGWRGASGSPVFIRKAIAGVVISCPEHFNQARLSATPLKKLAQNQDFLASIGRPDNDLYRKKVEDNLMGILEAHPDVVAALGGHDATGTSRQRARKVFEIIINIKFDLLLRMLKAVCKLFIEGNNEGAARAVGDIAFTIIPFVVPGDVIEAIRAQQGRAGYQIVPLPIATKTVAEIMMAKLNQRSASFLTVSDSQKWRGGPLQIPDPPEGGFSKCGPKYCDYFDQHMINKFASEFADQWDPKVLFKYVSMWLNKSNEENSTHYFVYNLMVVGQSDKIEQILFTLKDHYPPLVLICLSDDSTIFLTETANFSDLLYFIDLRGV